MTAEAIWSTLNPRLEKISFKLREFRGDNHIKCVIKADKGIVTLVVKIYQIHSGHKALVAPRTYYGGILRSVIEIDESAKPVGFNELNNIYGIVGQTLREIVL